MLKIKKKLYIVKNILFIIQFYFVFSMLSNILQVKYVNIFFIILYSIYVIRILFEILSKKRGYKEELVYNLMQICTFIYIGLLWYKMYYENALVTLNNMRYFQINYTIISVLLIFLLVYSFIGIDKVDSKGEKNEGRIKTTTK